MTPQNVAPSSDRLVIIGCGKAKIWDRKSDLGAVPARDAYTGPLFKSCRHYAEASGDVWVILSAKYGLLHPNQPITQYNVSFKNSEGAISEMELRSQWLSQFQQVKFVTSMASKLYETRLRNVLHPGIVLSTPLAGKNLFERMRWLKNVMTTI